MARNISISVSVQDQYSQSISSMREKTVAFNKDIEELTAKIKSLNKEKISLNIDAVKAQQTLRDLQQQFKNTGNAADQMVLQLANANYSNVNKQIERISKSAQDARKELANFVTEYSKADNRAGTVWGNGNKYLASKNGGIHSNSIIYGGTYNSYYENNSSQSNAQASQSNYAGDFAAIGGAIGTALGGGVGGAIGTIGGYVFGSLIDSNNNQDFATENIQNDDKTKSAFKNYVTNRYNLEQQTRISDLTEGSALAAALEDKNSRYKSPYAAMIQSKSTHTKLNSILSDAYDEEQTKDVLETIKNFGLNYGLTITEITDLATQLSNLKDVNKNIIPILENLKNTSDNIDVYQQLAKEKNISETQVENSIKNGTITRDEVISATLNTVQQESEDNTTYNDLASEWQNSLNQLKTAEGEGYNTKRKEQLEKNIQFFNENGEKLTQIKYETGRTKAEIDNQQDAALLEELNIVLNNDITDENLANRDGLALDNQLSIAKITSEENFAKTDLGQEVSDSNNELAQSIVENSVVSFTQDVYALSITFAKGVDNAMSNVSEYIRGIWAQTHKNLIQVEDLGLLGNVVASLEDGNIDTNSTSFQNFNNYIKDSSLSGSSDAQKLYQYSNSNKDSSYSFPKPSLFFHNAFGLERVPYDNYPTLLHQGEQVLTAQQVRQQKNIPSVTVTGNQFVIREEADITKVAKAFVAEMQKAYAIT